MDDFFIRFIMQRSIGTFEDDTFRYDYFMETTKEDIDSFIRECVEWQKEQAAALEKEFDLKELHGKRILYVGDSITADRLGYRGITAFAAKLNPYNAAISSAHSADMLRYLYDNIQISQPEIISVMIGTNDALTVANEKNVISAEEYRKNISEILRIAKQRCADVIISTLPPVNETRFAKDRDVNANMIKNNSIDILCEIIRDEAKKSGAIINDISKILKDCSVDTVIEKDGVHLTKAGQILFARNWLRAITTRL